MEWISVEKVPPEQDVLYAICTYNATHKCSIPADSLAIFRNDEWRWWVDCPCDIVEEKVMYYMELELPKED